MSQDVTWEITNAVANSEGIDPTEVDFVLTDHIDVDGLNRLLEHGDSTWALSFELPEHSVTVTSDGAILVDSQPEENWISQ